MRTTGEIEEGYEISEGFLLYEIKPNGIFPEHNFLVGGCIIGSSLGLQGSYRSNGFNGSRRNIEFFLESKVEHGQFYGD